MISTNILSCTTVFNIDHFNVRTISEEFLGLVFFYQTKSVHYEQHRQKLFLMLSLNLEHVYNLFIHVMCYIYI